MSFPSTMVDRVVPATTAEDREEVARALGLEDHGAVVAEPFRQWVIEDDFAGPRPAWDRAGALLVARRRPARGGQAAAAQRHALDARLRRRARRRAHGRRRLGRSRRWRPRRSAARRRGPRAVAARGAGHRHRRLPRRARPPLDQPADRAPARADRRRRLAEAAGALRRARPPSGSTTARRRAGSRSCIAAWARHLQEPDDGLPVTIPAPRRCGGARARRRPRRARPTRCLR